MSMREKNIEFIEGCICLVVFILTIASLAFAIYVNIHWWIDWTSFLIVIGAFLAFLAVSFVASLSALLLATVGWDDDECPVMVAFEAILTACLSTPLWYYHALTPGHTGFWSWIMLTVCAVVPLSITGVSAYFSWLACKKDSEKQKRQEESIAAELNTMKEKWAKYILGDGVDKFKAEVVQFIEKVNIHFAHQCCIRMIPESAINWQIVDKIIEHEDREALSKGPYPSYANIKTEFCVKGNIVEASFNLSHAGYAYLGWNGAKKGEKIASWEELITVIDEKIGG